MSTFYDSPNDYRNYLCHYGVPNMKRPHGLKYKKRGGSLREHRLNQVYKNDFRNNKRDEYETLVNEEHRQRSNNSENRIDTVQERSEIKRRREEQMQLERQREDERLSGSKSSLAKLGRNKKRLQSLVDQINPDKNKEHRHIYYESVRRKRKGR